MYLSSASSSASILSTSVISCAAERLPTSSTASANEISSSANFLIIDSKSLPEVPNSVKTPRRPVPIRDAVNPLSARIAIAPESSTNEVPSSAASGPTYCIAVPNDSNDSAELFIVDTRTSPTITDSDAVRLN